MKLYEINNALMELFDPETGEITDTALWDALQLEREQKLEGVACWVKNLLADADAIKAEKDNLAAREKAARNKAERLTAWLEQALGGEKLNTAKCAVSYRRSEAVEIADEAAFVAYAQQECPDLLTYKQPVPNKTAIKAALKDCREIAGVALVAKQNMSIK